jgi:acetylglutamate kinase
VPRRRKQIRERIFYMDNMESWIEKANVLVEALPYIREFNGKKIVVKYGGSAMKDSALKKSVVTDVALLKLVGMKPIIVHGGGKEISKWAKLSGITPEFVNGLRVTDEKTMEIAEMVLGKVNKGLVQYMEENGVKACGISGKDGGTMRVVRKAAPSGRDIGYVGEVTDVDTSLIDTLIEQDFVPVICPIGLGSEDYKSYNINADDAACAVASAVRAEKLAFLSDIEGVYEDPMDPTTLISELTVSETRKFIEAGNAGGGMLPKLQNCIHAIENGVSRVHILDGRIMHCLLLEFFTNKGIGTAILEDSQSRYYNG